MIARHKTLVPFQGFSQQKGFDTMKNNSLRFTKGISFLLISGLTAACVNIVPTEYLWQNFVSQENTPSQEQFGSITDNAGNTYHAFAVGSENFMRKVSATGVELWRVPMKHSATSLTVTQNGIIGVSEKDLSAGIATMIANDGSELWSKTLVKPKSWLSLVSSSPHSLTVAYEEYNTTTSTPEFTYSSFTLDGEESWTYTYDTKNYLHDYYPPFELGNGNIILLLPAAIDESSPDYQPAASTLTSVLLDNNGAEIARHDLGVMTYNNGPFYFMQNDHVYFTRRQGDHSILSRLNTDGSIEWSYIGDELLDCSPPTDDRIACINTEIIEPQYSRNNSLLFVGLDGTLISSTTLPYNVENINKADRVHKLSNILFNGNDKWITKEYVGPSSAINAIDALVPKTFYYKYHVIDQNGVETSSIITAPGKVRFNANIFGDFVIPVAAKETDIPNHANAISDTLYVTGWHGNFGRGNGFVMAYPLK